MPLWSATLCEEEGTAVLDQAGRRVKLLAAQRPLSRDSPQCLPLMPHCMSDTTVPLLPEPAALLTQADGFESQLQQRRVRWWQLPLLLWAFLYFQKVSSGICPFQRTQTILKNNKRERHRSQRGTPVYCDCLVNPSTYLFCFGRHRHLWLFPGVKQPKASTFSSMLFNEDKQPLPSGICDLIT